MCIVQIEPQAPPAPAPIKWAPNQRPRPTDCTFLACSTSPLLQSITTSLHQTDLTTSSLPYANPRNLLYKNMAPSPPLLQLLCQGWHNSLTLRHSSINSACEGMCCHCLLPLPAGQLHPPRGAPRSPIMTACGGERVESCSWEGAFRENVLALTPEGGKGETGMRHSSPLLLI